VSCHMSLSLSSVNFYLNCFFSVSLSLILMKLGVSDRKASVYKVTERILKTCIKYAN